MMQFLKANEVIIDAHLLSEEEFEKKYPQQINSVLYHALANSKVGDIVIRKVSDNPGVPAGWVFSGHTNGFGVGLALYVDNDTHWYNTSTVLEIDWEKKFFRTHNSIYSFDFNEETPSTSQSESQD